MFRALTAGHNRKTGTAASVRSETSVSKINIEILMSNGPMVLNSYVASSQFRPVVSSWKPKIVTKNRSSSSSSSNGTKSAKPRAPSLKRAPKLSRQSTIGVLARLTETHKKLLQQSFADMEDDGLQRNGLYAFMGYFSDYPDYKRLFPTFRSIHDSVLMGSTELRNHVVVYMAALKEMIDLLGVDEDALFAKLKVIAATHRRKGVRKFHIEHNCPKVIQQVKGCSQNWTNDTEEAWKILYDVIAILVEHFKDN